MINYHEIDPALRDRFQAGFHPRRPSGWRWHHIDGTSERTHTIPVSKILTDLDRGVRRFGYGNHDACVYRALRHVVSTYNLRECADIGCESGVFPAMALHTGIRHVTLYEIRPITVDHPDCEVRLKNLINGYREEPQYDLVTCLSTIEHVGLGRYGDDLDPEADFRLAEAMRALVRPGGILILSFPVGRPCVLFNAARVYSPYRYRRLFGNFKILRIFYDMSLSGLARSVVVHIQYGRCGWQPVFVLQKPAVRSEPK